MTIVVFCLIYFLVYSNTREGLIMYNYKTPILNKLHIPEYSDRELYKLYDSIYFDSNGTLIELFGNPFSETSDNNINRNITDIILMKPGVPNLSIILLQIH